jgi:hypothetical protein
MLRPGTDKRRGRGRSAPIRAEEETSLPERRAGANARRGAEQSIMDNRLVAERPQYP